MNIKDFLPLISIISEEKGFTFEKTKEIVEQSIAAAYKKEYGEKSQIIRCEIDINEKKISFFKINIVVDQNMIYINEEGEKIKKYGFQVGKEDEKFFFNEEKHIILKEAKKIDKKYKVGDEIYIKLEEKAEFGRIAAQSAKQVILQKIKEEEKNLILKEYIDKEGEIISGIVQRYDGENIIFDIGKASGVLPKEEQIYNESYKIGKRFKLYIFKIQTEGMGHFIFLSRSSPKLIEKLFELEIPEILSGQIEIKAIAREPGNRTKIAFRKIDENIDVIGSAVGPKGVRIMAIVDEFQGEKIDIIKYSDEIEEFIANSLSPAKIVNIEIKEPKIAEVTISFDQISLAIGREGQNVRLASKLTGWNIDIKKQEKNIIIDKETDDSELDKENKL